MKPDLDRLKDPRAARIALVLFVLPWPSSAAGNAPKFTQTVHVASHQLGFSNVVVSVKEDYRRTTWPVAHRTLILRSPSGRLVSMEIHDGGAGRLTTLSLYKRAHPQSDSRGHTIGGDYVLLGAQDCVGFDPVFLDVKRCGAPPPCKELVYVGRFDWANGYDPPKGQFQFGWRFLPFEEGAEEAFCSDSARGS